MELILKYFPELSEKQTEQFHQLDALYHDWNAKINVISRKDIDNLYEHHVLHSLGIAEFTRFKSGTEIMDLGTGGGFPGIPLAIMFPDCHFHLVDSIGKKIKVCMEVARELGLENVTFRHCRAEEEKAKFDFVVSRAVMPLADLVKIVRKNISPVHPQRPYLPEGWRIGERDEPGEEPHNGHSVERVLYGRIFCHQESGVRFTLKDRKDAGHKKNSGKHAGRELLRRERRHP